MLKILIGNNEGGFDEFPWRDVLGAAIQRISSRSSWDELFPCTHVKKVAQCSTDTRGLFERAVVSSHREI
jgi:hypothetical protein